jgi:alpha-beta hydrolase superfamily lysophospholipase
MNEIEPLEKTFLVSDGYPVHVTVWPHDTVRPRGQVVVLHGVQSHGGWYHQLGRTLAASGYAASFPDRRGSGANQLDRGHTPSARRLILDLREWLETLRAEQPCVPVFVAGISWGAKLVVITASRFPELIDGIALICPGLHPRVGVTRKERFGIAWALLADRRKRFPIPLSDPALFTADPAAQAFIASDPHTLREGTARLMAASFFIDRFVRRCPQRVHQPAMLMLAGHDRIVDNERTLEYFGRLASTDREVIHYPDAHHTLEFEPDPSHYALDLVAWLDRHAPDPSDQAGDGGTAQANAASIGAPDQARP